jgi:hypothetical protein
MALPNDSDASTAELAMVAQWTRGDLEDATVEELKTIISRIITSKYYLYTSSKYQLVSLNANVLSGTNVETLVNHIVDPSRRNEEINKCKTRSVQRLLLECAEQNILNPAEFFTEDEDNPRWIKRGEGNNLEDWEFTNEAIKDIMRTHWGDSGNPFTMVKIDDRSELSNYLWDRDVCIVHRRENKVNSHRFVRGICNHFGDFPIQNRAVLRSRNVDRERIITDSGLRNTTTAEGFLLGVGIFVENESFRNFFDIPLEAEVAIIPAHRRGTSATEPQVEIDCMLLSVFNQQTRIIILEVKKDLKHLPNWSGGFSFHQVVNTTRRVAGNGNISTITPGYVRIENCESIIEEDNRFTMLLDRFAPLTTENLIPRIIDSLDITNLPM